MYNTDNVVVHEEVENLCALSSVQQMDKDNSTLQCVINDGASDDRADKCSINNHLNGRRRSVAFQAAITTTDKQGMFICL